MEGDLATSTCRPGPFRAGMVPRLGSFLPFCSAAEWLLFLGSLHGPRGGLGFWSLKSTCWAIGLRRNEEGMLLLWKAVYGSYTPSPSIQEKTPSCSALLKALFWVTTWNHFKGSWVGADIETPVASWLSHPSGDACMCWHAESCSPRVRALNGVVSWGRWTLSLRHMRPGSSFGGVGRRWDNGKYHGLKVFSPIFFF